MIDVVYKDRVKNVYSRHRTNDEELDFARTIEEDAETILVATDAEREVTDVQVSTVHAVYHFRTFHTHYAGHASRTLVELMNHFKVSLPLDFVMDYRTFTIYLTGNKVVAHENMADEEEFTIAIRDGVYELVERVEWDVRSNLLSQIFSWSELYQVEPVEIVEQAITLIADRFSAQDGLVVEDSMDAGEIESEATPVEFVEES